MVAPLCPSEPTQTNATIASRRPIWQTTTISEETANSGPIGREPARGSQDGTRFELGILSLGAAGLVLNAVLLFFVPQDVITSASSWTGYYLWTAVLLFALGVSAGLFNVPLESYLQHRSPPESRGSVLAASNLITFTGILLTAARRWFPSTWTSFGGVSLVFREAGSSGSGLNGGPIRFRSTSVARPPTRRTCIRCGERFKSWEQRRWNNERIGQADWGGPSCARVRRENAARRSPIRWALNCPAAPCWRAR